MNSPYASDQELRDAGFLALRAALGPDDAFRFIRLYRPGPGDYTEERVLHVGNPSLEELKESFKRMREAEAAGLPIGEDPEPTRFELLQDLKDAAFLALEKALGSADALRFMRLYRPEPWHFGDERSIHVGDSGRERFMEGVGQMREAKAGEKAA
jgi:hypothetical protein